ncbi:hypothetical protein D3C87_1494960 [compost metagenome]
MRHALAEAQQHRFDPLKRLTIATDHDRQAAGLRTDYTARHRRIEPTHAGLADKLGSHFSRGRRFQAGKVHQQLAAFRPLANARWAKHHLAHHRRVRQTQHHHIGVQAQFGRGRDLPRPGLDQRRALGRIAVPHRQRVTRREQSPTHRQPHQANSSKTQRR